MARRRPDVETESRITTPDDDAPAPSWVRSAPGGTAGWASAAGLVGKVAITMPEGAGYFLPFYSKVLIVNMQQAKISYLVDSVPCYHAMNGFFFEPDVESLVEVLDVAQENFRKKNAHLNLIEDQPIETALGKLAKFPILKLAYDRISAVVEFQHIEKGSH